MVDEALLAHLAAAIGEIVLRRSERVVQGDVRRAIRRGLDLLAHHTHTIGERLEHGGDAADDDFVVVHHDHAERVAEHDESRSRLAAHSNE